MYRGRLSRANSSGSSFQRLLATKAGVSSQNFYETLGLESDASTGDIKAAYYKLSKLYHPDTTRDDQQMAAKKFQAISDAYEVLGNVEKKNDYDIKLTNHSHEGRRKMSCVERRFRNEFGFSPDLDPDYRDLIEFQLKWRQRNQRIIRQTYAPPEFWENRKFRAFYEPPKGFEAEETSWSDSDFYQPKSGLGMDMGRKEAEQERAKAEGERRRAERERRARELRFQDAMPSIQELYRQREARMRKRRQENAGYLSVVFLALCLFFVIMQPNRRRR